MTDAEVVTLCVAQAIMGIASDHRFARIAAKLLRHLFPGSVAPLRVLQAPRALADMIELLIDQFARMSPGYHDPLLLVDATRSNARDLGRRSNAAATTASQTP